MSWVWTSPMAGSPLHRIPPLRTKQTGQNPPYSIGRPHISKSCTRSGAIRTVLQVIPSSSYLQEHFGIFPKVLSFRPCWNQLLTRKSTTLDLFFLNCKLPRGTMWIQQIMINNTIGPELFVSYFCVLSGSSLPFLRRCSIANLKPIVGPDGKRGHLSEL